MGHLPLLIFKYIMWAVKCVCVCVWTGNAMGCIVLHIATRRWIAWLHKHLRQNRQTHIVTVTVWEQEDHNLWIFFKCLLISFHGEAQINLSQHVSRLLITPIFLFFVFCSIRLFSCAKSLPLLLLLRIGITLFFRYSFLFWLDHGGNGVHNNTFSVAKQ